MKKSVSRIWLFVACGITVVFGLVAAAGSWPGTSGPWLALFDLLRWPFDGNPAQFDPDTRAVNAVLGGVMAGWGAMMILLVHHFHASHFKLMRHMMVTGVSVWFAIDCVGSLLAGLPGNIGLNVLFLGVFLPPLLLVRKSS